MVSKTQDLCKLNWTLPGKPANPASWYTPLLNEETLSLTNVLNLGVGFFNCQ